jgi:hypothetical protein
MTSEKKARANRQNALKSTGPKTPEGKDAVHLNALKHGLLAQEVLTPGEDEAALMELAEGFVAELRPVGELEVRLAENIIADYWRLRRLRRVEAGIFSWQLYGELQERAQSEAQSYERDPLKEIVEESQGTTVTDEQKHQAALLKAQKMKAKQHAETTALGRAFVRDANEANAFPKLSRYETPIERRFYKALHELQRLQAARHANTNVTPPVALDVDVSGVSREDL